MNVYPNVIPSINTYKEDRSVLQVYISVKDRKMYVYLKEQVLNPQKGVSGTHSFKLIHIYVALMVNSWRSEVGSVDGLQNSTLGLVFGLQYSTLGWVAGLQYSSLG